jgi:hypothetical protein
MSTASRPAQIAPPQAPLRPPETVMRLARMGASFPTRLSFMRTLIRQLSDAGAQLTRPVWQIDDEGYGRAVYAIAFGQHAYSLVAFSTPLSPDRRTDRVIAEAWDTSYVLFDGIPDTDDLDRLERAAPLQEAGRFTERDLVLSRANKSMRLFEHVVDSLAAGRQPDAALVHTTGYLMRTTAVYGNGKFGIADRARLSGRPILDGPFRAEMLIVWLIRGFTHDLVEHIAHRRDPARAVPLDPAIKRHLGIGNATGLGMAPFLVSHPRLLHNWVVARETALARVRALPTATPDTRARAEVLIKRAKRHLADWSVDEVRHMRRIEILRTEFADLTGGLDEAWWQAPAPWDRLVRATEGLSVDCQELACALVLEPHGELVDDLETTMSDDERARIAPAMRAAELLDLIEANWSFALTTDFTSEAETAQFWYVSEEKLEPRLGLRYREAGADRELPLDVARRVKKLADDLTPDAPDETVAAFLMRHPEHRNAVRRIQLAAEHPYSEIRDNLIAARCLPIDMLRFKLAFFGASKFDPRSDLWTRVTLYQGAPLFDKIDDREAADDWWLPVLDAPD